MRDVTNLELRRGDRVIDAQGALYNVVHVTPAILHLQDTTTARRVTTGQQTMLRVSSVDTKGGKLGTASERKRFYRKLVTGSRRQMRG